MFPWIPQDISAPSRFYIKHLVVSLAAILLFLGLCGASYAATITVPAGGNVQAAINVAQCGDTIILESGATFRTEGPWIPFTLVAKPCGAGIDDPFIAIQSSNLALLPNGRVSPADRSNMAKLVALGPGGAITAQAGAHNYKLIGLEITTELAPNETIPDIVSLGGYTENVSNIYFDKCYVHSQEDGSYHTLTTSVRAFGSSVRNFKLTNSHVSGFYGYQANSPGTLPITATFLDAGGTGPILLENNFLEAMYTPIFLGGGGGSPGFTGVVQSGATLNSVTLDSVNNLQVGDFVTFPQPQECSSTPVDTGGPLVPCSTPGAFQLPNYNANGKIVAINGNTVTFASSLHHWTNQPTVCPCVPAAGSVAGWRGVSISNVRILRNTIQQPTQFAQSLYDASGINTGHKGYWEVKNGDNIWVEGNIFRGWYSSLTFTVANQTGNAPWTTINNLTIRNNLMDGFTVFGIMVGGGYHLADDMHNILIENNLVIGPTNLEGEAGYSYFATTGKNAGMILRHNTVVNSQGTQVIKGLSPSPGTVIEDNIFYHNLRGIQCAYDANPTMAGCFPGLVERKNVYIDNSAEEGSQPRYPNSYWVSRATYLANPTNPVGWVDPSSGNYALSPTSPYKNMASDGTDPGVNMAQLEAALAGNIPPPPTPTPTPSPTPQPSPTPSPGPGSDFVWFEDDVPAGASLSADLDAWTWISSNPAPFSGSVAHQSSISGGHHQHFFQGATNTLAVNSGEKLFVHVFLDPQNLPAEIMLQWKDNGSAWEHRAYWGANLISSGSDGSNSRRFMGPLPTAGEWVRLEVPASQVGLEGSVINGMAFTLHGGRVTWDRAGKTSQSAPSPTPTPTPTPSPTPSTQLGQSVLVAKRDGQDLSNELAASNGTNQPGTSMDPVTVGELQVFVIEIQQAMIFFNVERNLFPAAVRIEAELNGALASAVQATTSATQGDLVAARGHLRAAIDHLELTVALISHGNISNGIDVTSFMVRQHYVDFLDREPDQGGADFWAANIDSCGSNAQCIEVKRINVSAAFFLSIEFQNSGYFVYRLYKSSYVRMPLRAEFLPDSLAVSRGVIVGTPGWEARLAASKQAFLDNWVQRPEFITCYGALTNEQFVGALVANLGVQISSVEQDSLVMDLQTGTSRATVLGRLVDHPAFVDAQTNRAFVLMQYFGYLRRDPDGPGFNFWLDKLNQFGGDYIKAEMVKAFLSSIEYRDRFD